MMQKTENNETDPLLDDTLRLASIECYRYSHLIADRHDATVSKFEKLLLS